MYHIQLSYGVDATIEMGDTLVIKNGFCAGGWVLIDALEVGDTWHLIFADKEDSGRMIAVTPDGVKILKGFVPCCQRCAGTHLRGM